MGDLGFDVSREGAENGARGGRGNRALREEHA